MSLLDADRNKHYNIDKLTAEGALKHRLMSLGIIAGGDITMLNAALGKSTIQIKVGKMRLALRKSEAEKIYLVA